LTLRFRLLIGQNMDNLITKTTLWSDCPLENVSQGETIGGLQRLCLPLSEGLILK
jgi:hypothetical protein